MASAMYTRPPQAPPLFIGTPQSVIADAKRICEKNKAMMDEVARTVNKESATFKNVALVLAQFEDEARLENSILGFYNAVSANKELRDASTEAEKMMDEFAIEANMREDMYELIEAAYGKKEDLDAESQRFLEKERRSYIQYGLGIEKGPKRDRFKEIKKRQTTLSSEFSKALNEENGGIWVTEAEMDGVPKDVIGALKKGEGEHDGKLKLTFQYPDLIPTLKYAKDAKLRRRLFIESENKVNSNVPLFRETIILRDEAARLLGYSNHAALRTEDKMAKTPEWVNNFLGDLRKQLKPGGKAEIEHLMGIKKQDLEARGMDTASKEATLYSLWDHKFYDRLMVEQEFSVDEEAISQYFPITETIAGMLSIFEDLFGMKFVQLEADARAALSPTSKGEDLTWHEDVIMYSVWDSEDMGTNSEFIGYLYLDLHPREGKYSHAANFGLQPGFLLPNGTRRYPATALVCNFSKPTPKKPSLLKHDEVVTLFHELGHGIHDLVGRTTYSRFHGTNVVRDFVEAPSQMLENWCWEPAQLKRLSSHWQTKEPITDDLISKLVKTKHVNDALFNLRQLHFGTFDMTVHSPASHAAVETLEISELYNTLRTEISGLSGPEALGMGNAWGHGQATFGHLMGGYDAGYYGYLSSQVYSTDMFYSVFKKDPMNAAEGRRYRRMVLQKGGSQDEMETLKEFLGREPSSEAFYRELGIKASKL